MPAERRDNAYNALVEALINGQRRTVAQIDRLATRVEELTGEMIKFSRNQIQMRSDIAELRADMDTRLSALDRRFEAIDRRFDAIDRRCDAILSRVEELDEAVDKNATDIHKIRIELVGQYNDILNALQSGHHAKLDIEEINARLDDLERRAGMNEE